MGYQQRFRPDVGSAFLRPDDRRALMWCHGSLALGLVAPECGFVAGPVLAHYVVSRRRAVREEQSLEALNMGVTLSLGYLAARVLGTFDPSRWWGRFSTPEVIAWVVAAVVIWRSVKRARNLELVRHRRCLRLVRPWRPELAHEEAELRLDADDAAWQHQERAWSGARSNRSSGRGADGAAADGARYGTAFDPSGRQVGHEAG